MHRLGVRHAEVAVISDELIKKVACADLDPANNNAINEADQSVDFIKLQTLSLSFQNIFKMENLETLRHLVKLQLDNNVLQEIDGIGHLVHLEWLDLSFNNISTIKGLENLTELTDLSLYNNCISKLENLDTLKKLQVLSIGNNQLPSTEGLLYLKCLEKLRVLNLSGNPVCSDPEYRPFLLAHLEKLQYLDYALVDENETVQAREQYQDELEELKEVKAIEDAALAREAEQQKYLSMLKDANVIILETLLTDMFKEDTEMSKIEVLPGLRNIIDDYTEKAKTAAEDVKLVLLEKHAGLRKEVDGFSVAYEKLQTEAQESSIRAVEAHRRAAKQLLKQAAVAHTAASAEGDGSGSAAALQLLHDAEVSSEKLHSELMNLESDVVETAQELIAAMESSIEAVGSEARDIATEHFRTIEVLENNFFENVSQLAVTLLERMASDDGEDDDYLTDECRAILNDRDALNNAINGSHDIHIGKLLSQEDAMREQSLAKVTEIVKGAKEQEWTRNRARITEVLHLKEKHLSEVNRVRDEINRVDEEFY
ncbi:Dynein regulatory complex subunit 3 [Phytophthora boehmeriae]|uniref:Dynein regulatory complex subunit 3 n=1 Tax=Phytophthora boehmeriae TaxID=109152 RepID=A0A8T1WYM9_9STRA|nr:Dynein regulatory complex subunit 3 [Phytophthora boehmeriae]